MVFRECPWKDYAGNSLKEGDCIQHPSGETAKIVFIDKGHVIDSWLCEYPDGTPLSRLVLQLGEKGQAVKI